MAAPAVSVGGHKAADREALGLRKTDLCDEVANSGLVPTLLRAGIHVLGNDLSPLIMDEAVARNPRLKGIVADVRRLPFANDSFDAVFSGSTLDHLSPAREMLRALEEIARLLRPGGRLLITMDHPLLRPLAGSQAHRDRDPLGISASLDDPAQATASSASVHGTRATPQGLAATHGSLPPATGRSTGPLPIVRLWPLEHPGQHPEASIPKEVRCPSPGCSCAAAADPAPVTAGGGRPRRQRSRLLSAVHIVGGR